MHVQSNSKVQDHTFLFLSVLGVSRNFNQATVLYVPSSSGIPVHKAGEAQISCIKIYYVSNPFPLVYLMIEPSARFKFDSIDSQPLPSEYGSIPVFSPSSTRFSVFGKNSSKPDRRGEQCSPLVVPKYGALQLENKPLAVLTELQSACTPTA